MDERRKLRHEQAGIGRGEQEVAAQHPHIGRPVLQAVTHFAHYAGGCMRVERHRFGRLEARHGKARRCGQQQEIAGTQGDLATGAETNKTISAKDEVERQRAGRRRLMIDRECALQATADVERWLQAGKFDKAA